MSQFTTPPKRLIIAHEHADQGDFIGTPNGDVGCYSPRFQNKELSWAEKLHTINEVGSIFTLQGFDLNYAGVIIGPSVQYRDGKIVFVPEESHNPIGWIKETFCRRSLT
ncbi:DNA/RNA helicase domain-containing protein [Corynebacterium diphtheriae]|uniref:DNA/RNA helicase domain-containing protein n=1 Tax=Corynebacterium diphtheriae TaxID=1717 RepID=UPI0030FAF8FD